MRFYYLILTLLFQSLYLSAQPTDLIQLSPEQIARIQIQGVEGIQSVFQELEIQIQDVKLVEEYAYNVASAQINNFSNDDLIKKISTITTVAMAELAKSDNMNVSFCVEYTAAGILRSLINENKILKFDVLDAINAGSNGCISGAIQFAANNATDIRKVASAVCSGSLAGTIEATNNLNLDMTKAVEASSKGCISGTVESAAKLNLEIFDLLTSSSSGLAEAAIEASIKINTNLRPQIKSASFAASKDVVRITSELNLDTELAVKAVSTGLILGSSQAIPGQGKNIRIFIAPVKSIDAIQIQKSFEYSIHDGGKSSGYLPIKNFIIETPLDDDPSLRRVSPIE